MGASVASVALAVALACLAEAAALGAEADGGRIVDMVLVRLLARWDLDLQAYPHAHRTPVLKPQIKPRTNKALSPKRREGRDSLPSCSM